jgi:RimJ/RimL family protein N-acetyltransferase
VATHLPGRQRDALHRKRRTWGRRTADEVFDRALSHWSDHGFGWRSALERTNGEWLGLVALNYLLPGAPETSADEVEIGSWIVRCAWARGLATERACALRDEGFWRVGLPRIIARVSQRISDRHELPRRSGCGSSAKRSGETASECGSTS